MTTKLHKLLLELNSLKEFQFLHTTLNLNKQLKNTVFNLDVISTSKDDKPSDLNFFIDHMTSCYYPINDDTSYEILKTLLFEHNFIYKNIFLIDKIKLSIRNIIEKSNLEKVNKEIVIFEFLTHNHIQAFINNMIINLMQIFLKEIVKNKINFDRINFKYTDMCFKLGEIAINFYMENIDLTEISKIFFTNKNYKENFYINMLKKNKNLTSFLKFNMQKKDDNVINELLLLFNVKNPKISSYLYKLFRSCFIYKTYEKTDKFPEEYAEIHKEYITYMIKLGCLILESFIENNIFSKDYLNIKFKKKNKNLKKPLIIKFNNKLLDFYSIKFAIQRPYLTENSLKICIYKTKNKMLKKDTEAYILDELLINICDFRQKNFIGHNFDMTTEIKKENYLDNKNNLATKFVIDTDYLYFFLNLLKYHMLKKNNDINISFIEQIKNHENIFLLYQITIDPIINFYDKYKNIKEIRQLFDQILIYLLDYNIVDYQIIEDYKKKLKEFQKNIKINLNFAEKTKIEIFINDLFNKIFSYKIFIKGLITECILYSNFRFFILDSFIDTRGRCYYNGFYLNPQSYPITKAFIKLYNPTHINEQQYIEILHPTIKKFINNNNYQNMLDRDLNTYTKFLNKQNILREEYLNSLLNTKLNINEDIIKTFQNIQNPIELSLKILEFIKPKINKTKKLYVVFSMLIRILYPQKELQNYYELDATASGLQMTAMLFQNKNLAKISNLINEQKDQIDIYDYCSYFLIKNLDNLQNNLNKIFITIPNFNLIKIKLIIIFDKYLNKIMNLQMLITETKILIGDLNNLFESIQYKEKFFIEYYWIIISFLNKKIKIDKENLYYLIILKGLKINILRKEFLWLDDWIKSRDFCKKSIMTYGYNATEYRRKEEWMFVLLKLNNYERRTDLFFITDIAENLFSFITFTKLNPSNWLRNLGTLIKNQIQRNISKNHIPYKTSRNIIIENKFFIMKLHCYKQIFKRIDVKGFENKRKHQLTIKYPKYIKKVFENHNNNKITFLIKQQNYYLLNRKFSANFIHSMDAFLVHIFKQKLFEISVILNKKNIIINHMTNHDNFSLTLEPFLIILLLDCYNIVYKYDYIHTLNNLDFYNLILKFKLECQTIDTDLLPGNFYQKINFIPSDINLSNNFVK